jgi:hypothetical protein
MPAPARPADGGELREGGQLGDGAYGCDTAEDGGDERGGYNAAG